MVRSGAEATAIWAALVPNERLACVTDITPAFLAAHGLGSLILDLDNTLAAWNGSEPAPGVEAWLADLARRRVPHVVLSNNGQRRVEPFARRVGVHAVASAGKPRRAAFRQALGLLGSEAGRTAVVGDRLFMDVLGGNRAGLFTILVEPVHRRELWATRAVRQLEDAILPRLPSAGA